jgi:hypothetical protein
LLYTQQQVKNCKIIGQVVKTVTLFALQTADAVKLSNIMRKTVTLFALHTAGEKLSHYLLYKLYIQQVKNCHIICFTYNR